MSKLLTRLIKIEILLFRKNRNTIFYFTSRNLINCRILACNLLYILFCNTEYLQNLSRGILLPNKNKYCNNWVFWLSTSKTRPCGFEGISIGRRFKVKIPKDCIKRTKILTHENSQYSLIILSLLRDL